MRSVVAKVATVVAKVATAVAKVATVVAKVATPPFFFICVYLGQRPTSTYVHPLI